MSNIELNPKISKYTIMYEDKAVLKLDRKTEEIVVYDVQYLPFWLRRADAVKPMAVLEWLIYRRQFYADIYEYGVCCP